MLSYVSRSRGVAISNILNVAKCYSAIKFVTIADKLKRFMSAALTSCLLKGISAIETS